MSMVDWTRSIASGLTRMEEEGEEEKEKEKKEKKERGSRLTKMKEGRYEEEK